MEKQTKKTTKKSTNKITKDKVISLYMDYVLENEQTPKSVYKFAKANKMTEDQFYNFFGSFEGLRQEIWHQFYQKSVDLIHKAPETESFTSREKMLTFFFTFFEMLTVNRSYVLFTLQENRDQLKNLAQLKGLRKDIKNFTKDLLQEDNDEKQLKILQKNETVFSEGAWIQTMFLIKFWMDDNSAEFEKTDVAIEKSVNTIFDVFDNTPFERVIDFGKFLFKERMA
ncbi:TetR family transcriptional regulator C-terminal domain-containing protein [Mesonia aquimarina]|uniref:TetR family transcriptional regulator C-terminal domain-containing protein n=1 Tax=Mesonia aquimarina TaxID=1504967 RepID=UPI000EF5B543|nr:TetR family transcriptional regulator C-terminal domain-containing protein [Mesonia aquimarina]